MSPLTRIAHDLDLAARRYRVKVSEKIYRDGSREIFESHHGGIEILSDTSPHVRHPFSKDLYSPASKRAESVSWNSNQSTLNSDQSTRGDSTISNQNTLYDSYHHGVRVHKLLPPEDDLESFSKFYDKSIDDTINDVTDTSDHSSPLADYDDTQRRVFDMINYKLAPALLHVFISCKLSVGEIITFLRRKGNSDSKSDSSRSGKAGSSARSLLSSESGGSNLGKRKRNNSEEDEEKDGDDKDDIGRTKHRIKPVQAVGDKRIACPFNKCKPWKYCDGSENGKKYKTCTRGFQLSKDLADHLRSIHCGPRYLCDRCSTVFKTKDDTTRHSQTTDQCDLWINPQFALEGYIMSDERRKALKKKLPSVTIEEHWYGIWDILFPDQARPHSIFQDTNRLEEAFDLAVDTVIPRFLEQALRDHPWSVAEYELHLRQFARAVRDRLWDGVDNELRRCINVRVAPASERAISTASPNLHGPCDGIMDPSVAMIQSMLEIAPEDFNVEGLARLQIPRLETVMPPIFSEGHVSRARWQSEGRQDIATVGYLTGPHEGIGVDFPSDWDQLPPARYIEAIAQRRYPADQPAHSSNIQDGATTYDVDMYGVPNIFND